MSVEKKDCPGALDILKTGTTGFLSNITNMFDNVSSKGKEVLNQVVEKAKGFKNSVNASLSNVLNSVKSVSSPSTLNTIRKAETALRSMDSQMVKLADELKALADSMENVDKDVATSVLAADQATTEMGKAVVVEAQDKEVKVEELETKFKEVEAESVMVRDELVETKEKLDEAEGTLGETKVKLEVVRQKYFKYKNKYMSVKQ